MLFFLRVTLGAQEVPGITFDLMLALFDMHFSEVSSRCGKLSIVYPGHIFYHVRSLFALPSGPPCHYRSKVRQHDLCTTFAAWSSCWEVAFHSTPIGLYSFIVAYRESKVYLTHHWRQTFSTDHSKKVCHVADSSSIVDVYRRVNMSMYIYIYIHIDKAN